MAVTYLQGTQVRDLSGGMVSNASDVLLPTNVAKLSVNLHYDVLGKATQRYGTTQLGATVESSKACTGLSHYVSTSGAASMLVAGFNASAYAYNGSTWASVRGSLDGTAIRMTVFGNLMFMVGGGGATQTYAGTGSFAAGSQVTGAPTGKYIDSFKDRVHILGNATNPDRLFRSSVIDSSGAITWDTSATGPWIDVNPEDGNHSTGLATTSDLILIFKQYSLFRWNGSALTFVGDIGTPSQESIVSAKGVVYFFSSSPLGIYATDGGMPVEISRPVHDWLQGMAASFYGSVCAGFDDDHAYFDIGNVTKDGRTFGNVQLVYTVSSKNWHVNCFADSFRKLARFVDSSGNITLVGGDTDGMVQTLFSGNTDNATPITYEHQSKQLEFDSRATTKQCSEIAAFVTNGAGTTVSVSSDSGPFVPQFEVTGPVTFAKGLNLRGHYFSAKVSGSNSSTPAVLEGYEFVRVYSLGHLTG